MDAVGPAWFASAVAFALAMSATPGPNNAMVTASGATWGFWRTLPHMLGIAVGFSVMLVAVALGAGELLRDDPWAQIAMRWVGAAYLLWLAWHIATARPSAPDTTAGSRARPLGFWRAALFQWINPKVWVISFGGVATYTSAGGAGGVTAQAVLLGVIFLIVTLPSTALWTLIGVGAARLLRTQAALRRFNIAMAALLVASLVPMIFGE